MLSIIYNYIFIPAAKLYVLIAKIFDEKLKDREDTCKALLQSEIKAKSAGKRIWFHAASMGEFEQAKPVIEILKKQNPAIEIIVSFYSPSGFNNQKNYPFADHILYMPIDSRRNAREFIDKIDPDLAVFVRYDLWHNHLACLKQNGIKSLLICATKPGSNLIDKVSIARNFYRANFNLISEIYTAGKNETAYFDGLNLSATVTSLADTRFDRIIEKVESASKAAILPINYYSEDDFVLVAGSTWPPDENVIIQSLGEITGSPVEEVKATGAGRLRIIFVPHEPTAGHIAILRREINNAILLSELGNRDPKSLREPQHIIVDCIGKLLSIYKYADAAYIGGAFGAGVHSTAEPAGYGIPLAAGPKMENSPDAANLKKNEALTIITCAMDLTKWLGAIIRNKDIRAGIGRKSKEYIYSHRGASQIVSERILEIIEG